MSPEELRELIDGLAGSPYGGEAVDERTHALQCAWHALRDGADDDLVLAALLHDAGRAVDPGLDHERSGEELGRRLLGERVGWLIGSHAQAKRHLVAVEPGYAATLSPASIASLRVQGGPMTAADAMRFATHPWAAVHQVADCLRGTELARALAPHVILLGRTADGIDPLEACWALRLVSLAALLVIRRRAADPGDCLVLEMGGAPGDVELLSLPQGGRPGADGLAAAPIRRRRRDGPRCRLSPRRAPVER